MQAQFQRFRRIITRREILQSAGTGWWRWEIALAYTVSVMMATRDSSNAFAGAREKDWARLGLFGDWPELVRLAILF
jgi:hypothetical protein